MELYEQARILASFATAIGVVIVVWQIWRNGEQAKTKFEDSHTKEYRELMSSIPYGVFIKKNVSEEQENECKEAIYNYLDFCNQQVYLRSKKRIRKQTWFEWQEGMKMNLELPLFKQVADEVFDAHPEIFDELKRVQRENYTGDPAHW